MQMSGLHLSLHGCGYRCYGFRNSQALEPSGDESGSGVTQGCGTCTAETPFSDLLSLAAQAGDEGCLEAIAEVSTEEAVDARIDAAVEV
ncbi:hypothetical protein TNCV_291941 [Trichonephila clavipes]|nr:hypothetical protein TNCV_291941 [Trichonephila clavipes]